MAKKQTFMSLYKEWMKTGKLPEDGLCGSLYQANIKKKKITMLKFSPTYAEKLELYNHGYDTAYWGSGLKRTNSSNKVMYEFTPLRQTIMLLCAAINNEL